jgi:EAL domain-containing protein (putative c-di-GMP-specific phosphodiesterase class I)
LSSRSPNGPAALGCDIDFVHDIASNPANQHLVKAFVSLAEAFGPETIAGRVEDEQTVALLREHGADCAQAFQPGGPASVEVRSS